MLNKKIALSVLLSISIGVSVFAQEPEIASSKDSYGTKTEFNIAVTNIFADPLYDLVLYDYYDNYYPELIPQLPGILAGMKFHNPKGAFRVNASLSYGSRKITDPDQSSVKTNYNAFSSDLNLGYEWHSNYKRVRVYYGFDALLGYQNSKTDFVRENNDTGNGKSNTFKYGISPLLGVNFFITPHLSVGTEVKLTAMGYSGKSESTVNYDYPNNYYNSYKNEFSGFQTYFGPLGFLSVNVYF
ncbi:MAG: hypothetical protein GXO89_16860 [Chlorobi bacterium]|nr:hypothetical protein [Chlorobiota bacterium]